VPRHAEARIDTAAVAHNVGLLNALAGPARLCVVVKADGYGHGAVEVSRAALAAGASHLAVALVEEGIELRTAGLRAPVLLLSEPPADALAEAWEWDLTPTLYHPDAVARAAAVVGRDGRWGVHVKVDTGMHRVGATPQDAVALAAAVLGSGNLVLEGVFTHLAVADEPDRPETAQQLDRFAAVVGALRDAGIDPGIVHAANSAGLIAHPAARLDMARVGIAAYGIAPSPALEGRVDLWPAMSVHAEVSHVAMVPAGEGISYGLRHVVDVDTTVAVVPLGYADGVRRALGSSGGSVLIGGVRRPIRGAVTMDQTVVEVGPAGDPSVVPVQQGDEVVLLGSQTGPGGTDRITASEWAERIGTIPYEVVCGFGARLPRTYP